MLILFVWQRIKREYEVETVTGKPKVAFRETLTTPVQFVPLL